MKSSHSTPLPVCSLSSANICPGDLIFCMNEHPWSLGNQRGQAKKYWSSNPVALLFFFNTIFSPCIGHAATSTPLFLENKSSLSSSILSRIIAELESALQEAITYLRALPVHVATKRAADAAEQVLQRQYHAVLQGGVRHMSGVLIIGAELNKQRLVLKTDQQALPEELKHQFTNALYARLVRGITLDLKTPASQIDDDFFELDSPADFAPKSPTP